MSADDVYESARMAVGYAFDRPLVHPRIIERICEDLPIRSPVARALDVGCGAGRSTAALEPLARRVVGLDPVRGMLAHRRTVAPAALFVVGRAEQLPFAACSFDIVTAAGALNYVELGLFLPDLARVLARDGVMVRRARRRASRRSTSTRSPPAAGPRSWCAAAWRSRPRSGGSTCRVRPRRSA